MPWNQQNNDKDPWERNKKQTPPDLDEVLKKFTSSFGSMFGSKKPANGEWWRQKGKRLLNSYITNFCSCHLVCNWLLYR